MIEASDHNKLNTNDDSIKSTYIVLYYTGDDDSVTYYDFDINKTVIFISSDHSIANANRFDALSTDKKKSSFEYKCIRTYTDSNNISYYYRIYLFNYNPLGADQRYNIYYI